MPSAEMRKIPTDTTTEKKVPVKTQERNITSNDVDNLVFELKENLRLSSSSGLKVMSCHYLSRRSSRASPYRIPNKNGVCENASCEIHRKKRKNETGAADEENPYELMQKLLREGGLLNEAVRRLQLASTTTKRRYSYESDEEASPFPEWYAKD